MVHIRLGQLLLSIVAHHLDRFVFVDAEWLRLINTLLGRTVGFKLKQWVLLLVRCGRLWVQQTLLLQILPDATRLFLILMEHFEFVRGEHMLHVFAMEADDCQGLAQR